MGFKVKNFLTVLAFVGFSFSFTANAENPITSQNLAPSKEDFFISYLVEKKISNAERANPQWGHPKIKEKYSLLLKKYVKYLRLDLSESDILLKIAQNSNSVKFAKLNIEKAAKTNQVANLEDLKLVQLVPLYNDMNNIVSRLFDSSLQFLNCKDMSDWACLEHFPEVSPSHRSRVETSTQLGRVIKVNSNFEADLYFTNVWKKNACSDKSISRIENKKSKAEFIETCNLLKEETYNKTVAKILSEKIETHANKNLYMAMYGIDDIQDTMKDVFKSIENKKKQNVNIYSVFDVTQEGAPNSFLRNYDVFFDEKTKKLFTKENIELNFSYIKPENEENWIFGRPQWMDDLLSVGQEVKTLGSDLSKRNKVAMDKISGASSKVKLDIQWLMGLSSSSQGKSPDAQRMTFQYNGTMSLINLLNSTAKTNEQSTARIEYPMNGIMHNKFLVMEDLEGKKYVWSGTTNIAKSCMGDESNSNAAIFIQNNEIADIFKTEFLEMYTPKTDSGGRQLPLNLVTGRFHSDKRPNTKRYLKFNDQTEVRVHFSPTDDGEHRVLIPMLLSAKENDIIRISMFGGAGTELVRAMQWAASKGAHIRIVFDAATGSGTGSWIKDNINVLEKNPYAENPKGSIEVRLNNWPGLNHHKSASLTRYESPSQYRPELLTLGSQNWSQSGNDENDENMITIQNKVKPLKEAQEFNKEFDQYMWKLSINKSL